MTKNLDKASESHSATKYPPLSTNVHQPLFPQSDYMPVTAINQEPSELTSDILETVTKTTIK